MTTVSAAWPDTRFEIETYFAGHTRAWGLFHNRKGRAVRAFTVDIRGYLAGGLFHLDERFVFADGATDRRLWKIRRVGPTRYQGWADDVVGTAEGEVAGNSLHWRYILALPFKGRRVNVDFDDWMFLQPDNILINRATVRKFGFLMGEVVIAFRPLDKAVGDKTVGDEGAASKDAA